MLKEVKNARQIPGESSRRWFLGDTFDLIVWYAPANTIVGFQLCYEELILISMHPARLAATRTLILPGKPLFCS